MELENRYSCLISLNLEKRLITEEAAENTISRLHRIRGMEIVFIDKIRSNYVAKFRKVVEVSWFSDELNLS